MNSTVSSSQEKPVKHGYFLKLSRECPSHFSQANPTVLFVPSIPPSCSNPASLSLLSPQSISVTVDCKKCGGFRMLPCAVCNGSKKSVHRNESSLSEDH